LGADQGRKTDNIDMSKHGSNLGEWIGLVKFYR
jgi:hypothetical protein